MHVETSVVAAANALITLCSDCRSFCLRADSGGELSGVASALVNVTDVKRLLAAGTYRDRAVSAGL